VEYSSISILSDIDSNLVSSDLSNSIYPKKRGLLDFSLTRSVISLDPSLNRFLQLIVYGRFFCSSPPTLWDFTTTLPLICSSAKQLPLFLVEVH